MTIEAMKQALAALHVHAAPHPMVFRAMDALRLAIEHAERPQTHSEECWRWHHQCAVTKIEQVQQDPVAWMYVNTDGECEQIEYIANEPMPDDPSVTPLYTAPRQWQGLTDEQIEALWLQNSLIQAPDRQRLAFARAIEAKLKEKNG